MGVWVCASGYACMCEYVWRLGVCLLVLRQNLSWGPKELESPGPAYLDLRGAALHHANLFVRVLGTELMLVRQALYDWAISPIPCLGDILCYLHMHPWYQIYPKDKNGFIFLEVAYIMLIIMPSVLSTSIPRRNVSSPGSVILYSGRSSPILAISLGIAGSLQMSEMVKFICRQFTQDMTPR